MSTGEWLGDQAKFLGGRLANAAMSLPGLPADLVGLQLRGMDWLAGNKTPTANPLEAFTGQTIRDAAHDYGSQAINALTGSNLTPEDLTPRDPRNTAERFAGNVADFIGYGVGPGALTKSALETAATGAAGLTAAQEVAPDSPLAQVAGAVIGHRVPAAIRAPGIVPKALALVPGLKPALRMGTDPSEMAASLDAIKRLEKLTGRKADVMPGQVMNDYSGQQILDAAIARSPGGQPGVMRANESQAKLFDEAVNTTASNPTGTKNIGAPNLSGTGSKIQEDFAASTEKFRARQKTIEDGFEKAIGADTRVPMSATAQAIAKLLTKAASDPKVAELIRDPYIAKVAQALEESGGTLSYSAARALKTDAGELYPKAGTSASVKGGQIKFIYDAMKDDITNVASQRGVGPQWERYNKWATENYRRQEKVLNKITNGREYAPENVADTMMRMPATSLKIAMRNLSEDGQSMVAGQFLSRMAETKASGKAAEGVDTSADKFIGNLLAAKRDGRFDAVFGSPKFKPLRDVVDDLDRTAKAARRANGLAHDVSGATVVRGLELFGTGGIFATLSTGNILGAASIYGFGWLLPAAAGKALRSRSYLNWLAYARQHPNDARLVMQRLSMVAARDRDPETREALTSIYNTVQQLSQQGGNSQQGEPPTQFTRGYPEAPGGYPYTTPPQE